MKKSLSLALVYIGLVIGAGFASGREILEYFPPPSHLDHSGILFASLLLMMICYLICERARRDHLNDYPSYLSSVAGRGTKAVKALILLYLFCGFFTMLAGSGALVKQSLMLPSWVGSLGLCLVCFLVLSFDLKGVVLLNSLLVPCMVGGILWIAANRILYDAIPTFSFSHPRLTALTSALCYVSYNTLSAASVLVPLQKGMSKRALSCAAIAGGFVLGLLILVICLCQGADADRLWQSDLPMLQIAAILGKGEKWFYTLILWMAMATTAISQGFGLLECLVPSPSRRRVGLVAILCLGALPFSQLGFANLVRHLYGFFGLAGLLWMGWLLWDFFGRKRL